MAVVGLEKLFYAVVTQDDDKGLVYETPKYLKGVREIGVVPSVTTEKLYAENKIWEQSQAIESVDVDIDLADLTNQEKSILLGHRLAQGGGIIGGENDIAPYVALLYKANKSNGEARYQVLYKGKFELPSDDAKGKEGKTDFQTPKMKATFQPTRNNGYWKYAVDSDDEGVSTTIDTDFFESVIIPTEKVITPAAEISGYTVAKGTTSGTTKITYTKGSGNTLATVVQATTVATPNVGDTVSATAYTSGSELAVTNGDHVGLYELDSEGKVVKFVDIVITSTNIAV